MDTKTQLLMVSRTLYWSGHSAQTHVHDSYSVHYICSGQLDFEVEGQPVSLKKGDCLLIPPFAEHCFSAVPEPGARVQTMRLTIADPKLDEQCRQLHPPLRGDTTLSTIMDCLYANWKQPRPGQGDIAEAMLITLLTLFCVRQTPRPVPDSRVLITDCFSETTRRVLQYVEHRFSVGFSLDELAAQLNYNKNYLCTVFSAEVGLSIIEYTNILRVRSAALLLAMDKARVDIAAEHTGFHSMSYFNRVFRSLVGMPPGRFARAFSALSREDWPRLIAEEPLLSYRLMTTGQLLEAIGHMGHTARRLSGDD